MHTYFKVVLILVMALLSMWGLPKMISGDTAMVLAGIVWFLALPVLTYQILTMPAPTKPVVVKKRAARRQPR